VLRTVQRVGAVGLGGDGTRSSTPLARRAVGSSAGENRSSISVACEGFPRTWHELLVKPSSTLCPVQPGGRRSVANHVTARAAEEARATYLTHRRRVRPERPADLPLATHDPSTTGHRPPDQPLATVPAAGPTRPPACPPTWPPPTHLSATYPPAAGTPTSRWHTHRADRSSTGRLPTTSPPPSRQPSAHQPAASSRTGRLVTDRAATAPPGHQPLAPTGRRPCPSAGRLTADADPTHAADRT